MVEEKNRKACGVSRQKPSSAYPYNARKETAAGCCAGSRTEAEDSAQEPQK